MLSASSSASHQSSVPSPSLSTTCHGLVSMPPSPAETHRASADQLSTPRSTSRDQAPLGTYQLQSMGSVMAAPGFSAGADRRKRSRFTVLAPAASQHASDSAASCSSGRQIEKRARSASTSPLSSSPPLVRAPTATATQPSPAGRSVSSPRTVCTWSALGPLGKSAWLGTQVASKSGSQASVGTNICHRSSAVQSGYRSQDRVGRNSGSFQSASPSPSSSGSSQSQMPSSSVSTRIHGLISSTASPR